MVLKQSDNLVDVLDGSISLPLGLADAIRVAPALGNCPTDKLAFMALLGIPGRLGVALKSFTSNIVAVVCSYLVVSSGAGSVRTVQSIASVVGEGVRGPRIRDRQLCRGTYQRDSGAEDFGGAEGSSGAGDRGTRGPGAVDTNLVPNF